MYLTEKEYQKRFPRTYSIERRLNNFNNVPSFEYNNKYWIFRDLDTLSHIFYFDLKNRVESVGKIVPFWELNESFKDALGEGLSQDYPSYIVGFKFYITLTNKTFIPVYSNVKIIEKWVPIKKFWFIKLYRHLFGDEICEDLYTEMNKELAQLKKDRLDFINSIVNTSYDNKRKGIVIDD